MPGLGTIINVVLLVAGGLLGLAGGRFITPRIQDTLMKASGLCVLFIGLGGTMQKMLLIDGKALATTGTTMLIVSFALGSLIGEAINLEAAIENLGEWRLHSPCVSAPWPLWDRSRTVCAVTGQRLP